MGAQARVPHPSCVAMAGPPSQTTKVLAAFGAGTLAAGFYWFAEPRLKAMLQPVPTRFYGEDEFAAAAKYQGGRPGWVFKMDHLGLGYYRDDRIASQKIE